MNTEWMGRYRPLVAALVRHTNIVQRALSAKKDITDENICLNAQEWQVLEYIIEHMNDDAHMNLISDRLGIPQSSFSKMVKALCGYGLVEKYQMTNNRKNIILRPSDAGISFYKTHSSSLMESLFSNFFAQLDAFSDEDIQQFTHALDILNDDVRKGPRPAPAQLVKAGAVPPKK